MQTKNSDGFLTILAFLAGFSGFFLIFSHPKKKVSGAKSQQPVGIPVIAKEFTRINGEITYLDSPSYASILFWN